MLDDALKAVAPRDADGNATVFIETPKGSRHKYDIDHGSGLFRWSLELPEGMMFPFSFGFVPNTLAEDGDPLDIVLLIDGSVPGGTLVASRLIGVLEMEQDEDGEMSRNDRVIAVANLSRVYGTIHEASDLAEGFSWDLREFFSTYNRMIGRETRMLGIEGAATARTLFDDAIAAAAK